jgi:hypothetical protein
MPATCILTTTTVSGDEEQLAMKPEFELEELDG